MKESILEFDRCKGMEPTKNAFEIQKGVALFNMNEIRETAISTMALLGHPAWLNANDKKTLNSPAISQWVFYNRAKMAVKRATVSQFVGGVRGVIPASKLALYGDYRYDLELEDMYDILDEMTSEQSDTEEFYVANLSSIMKLKEPLETTHDERHERNNKYLQSDKDCIQLDIKLKCDAKSQTSCGENPALSRAMSSAISQWISKWRKLLGHVRRAVNQGKAIDFWTDTLLKTCLKFLSAFKCNESLMQLMNTEIPFITNYNQLSADPISMIELLSLPQPAMENNLYLDSTQEDSLWLKLSSPFIRKLWTEEKGIWVNEKKSSRDDSFFGNLPDPTVGGTNFLRRQSYRSGKSGTSNGDIEVSEIKARELLGSLLDAMDENIAETSKSKPSFPEAHGEWTKRLFPHRGHLLEPNGDKSNEFHQHAEHENPNERIGPQLRHYPVAVPVPCRHIYPPRHHASSPQVRPPLPPCRIWNTTNRYPLQVAPPIPTSNSHSVQIIRGNFQPTNLQYRTESTMLPQISYPSLNYLPHKVLLLKSGQISQTEQIKNAFHPNIIHKTPMENPSALAFFDSKKEFPVQEKSSCHIKNSMPTNMQQYVLPYTDKLLQRITMLELTKIRKIRTSNVIESEQEVHPYYIKSAYVMKQKSLRAGFPKYNHKLTPCQRTPTYDMKAIQCHQNFLQDRAKLHLTQQWVECTDFEAVRANSELYSDSKTDEAYADRQKYLDTKLQTLNHAGRLQKRLPRIFSAYTGKYRHNQDHSLKHGELGKVSNRNQKPFSEYYLFNEDTVSLQHSNSLQDEVKYSNFFRVLHKILLKRLKKNSLKGTEMKFSDTKIRTSKVCRDDHLLRKYHMLKQIRTHLKFRKCSSLFSDIRRHERNSLKTANSTHLKDKKNDHQEVKGESNLKEFDDGYKLNEDSSQVSAESNSCKRKFKNTNKRYINPLHLRFEQKSWREKKIENHIDAQYFNMVADSLIMDSYFKVLNEYSITDVFNVSDDKIDGWVHFKMTVQEVLRKAANHLMNDSSEHASTQSRLFYNSFLNAAET